VVVLEKWVFEKDWRGFQWPKVEKPKMWFWEQEQVFLQELLVVGKWDVLVEVEVVLWGRICFWQLGFWRWMGWQVYARECVLSESSESGQKVVYERGLEEPCVWGPFV